VLDCSKKTQIYFFKVQQKTLNQTENQLIRKYETRKNDENLHQRHLGYLRHFEQTSKTKKMVYMGYADKT
jgi:hypothetical protein